MNFKEAWDAYAEKFNLLANLMMEHGLDPELLVDIIKAVIDLQSCT